jgi:ubiquinone/menaquinone biosynthesis C-methylase UbiE
MLGVARRSLPDVAFSEGPLELLPFPDGTFDVVTCALALTHLRNLGPAMAEFRRVLKPGGHLVTADVHPMLATLSGQASFPGGWIRNEIHWPGAYFRAFREAGLRVEECVEPGYDEKGLLSWYGRFPISLETHRAAWEGIPAVLAWRAQAPF